MTFAEVARGSLRVLGHASIVVFGLAGVVPLAAAADKDPEVPAGVVIVPHDPSVFRPDPQYEEKPYSADDQLAIYGGKFAVQTPRPIFELGRRQYTTGPFEPGIDVLGETNLFFPSLAVYGDWRTAVAFNDNGAAELGVVATRLNLDVDLKLTASERIHAFFRPVDQGGRFTRYEFAADDDDRFEAETDGNLETLFFEGRPRRYRCGSGQRAADLRSCLRGRADAVGDAERCLGRRCFYRPRRIDSGAQQRPFRHLQLRRHLLHRIR